MNPAWPETIGFGHRQEPLGNEAFPIAKYIGVFGQVRKQPKMFLAVPCRSTPFGKDGPSPCGLGKSAPERHNERPASDYGSSAREIDLVAGVPAGPVRPLGNRPPGDAPGIAALGRRFRLPDGGSGSDRADWPSHGTWLDCSSTGRAT
jgi:hypothetical protein